MIVAVASGKGGTGKTTVATSLAAFFKGATFVDLDVEAPNGHLFLMPEIDEEIEATIPVPVVIEDKCTYCGLCAEVCTYNAIFVAKDTIKIFDELCHGCGSCSYFCPEKALVEKPKRIGVIRKGRFNSGIYIGGILDITIAISPPLINEVKSYIKGDRVVIDAPPGTTCPMIEAVKDSNYVLLVAEPTPFGINDLGITLKVIKDLDKKAGIVINKSSLDTGIEELSRKYKIPILARIPFKKDIAENYSKGKLILEIPGMKDIFGSIWRKIEESI